MEATNTTEIPRDFVAERQRYSIRRAAEELRARISIEDYLRSRGVEVRRNRARCIVHRGDNPQSFSINPEKGLWHCFSCGSGGDLLDLAELVEEHADVWTAVVSLSMEFGIDLPERPQRWYEWQTEKGHRRKMIRDAMTETYRRRLFRAYAGYLADIEDGKERERQAKDFWDALWPVARAAAIFRMAR
jgi:DNA primase